MCPGFLGHHLNSSFPPGRGRRGDPAAHQRRSREPGRMVPLPMALCSTDVPEVELISLLGEQLPRYTLRADTVFGYDHGDWLRASPGPPQPVAPLTPQQIEATLQYFLLCAERVVRITKTYHDIDAVTNLLDEKERDLELAARIGQSLLKQNRSLTERNELLEEQLELAKEEIAQLRHEVSMRDDLLHFYTTTTEESEPTTTPSTPLRRQESSVSLQQYFQYDTLQQKLKCLEEENQKLRMEVSRASWRMHCPAVWDGAGVGLGTVPRR
uniref:HAP1 N-terminal domain-containing protein n=1 Tax=Zosterops lateralis melanops TaxID=1220523 RepID=A0A8D2P2U7_ZOSLA